MELSQERISGLDRRNTITLDAIDENNKLAHRAQISTRQAFFDSMTMLAALRLAQGIQNEGSVITPEEFFRVVVGREPVPSTQAQANLIDACLFVLDIENDPDAIQSLRFRHLKKALKALGVDPDNRKPVAPGIEEIRAAEKSA